MNEQTTQQAWWNGFFKAARDNGLSPKEALSYSDLIGPGVGALGGAGLGYLSGDDADPATGKKSTRGRNALAGGLGGAGAGFGIQQLIEALSQGGAGGGLGAELPGPVGGHADPGASGAPWSTPDADMPGWPGEMGSGDGSMLTRPPEPFSQTGGAGGAPGFLGMPKPSPEQLATWKLENSGQNPNAPMIFDPANTAKKLDIRNGPMQTMPRSNMRLQ